MKQNSSKYAKISLIVFAVSFVVAAILYFSHKPGKVEWLDYKEGISKAASEGKPIFLYPYYYWSSTSKMANKSIYSEDNIVELIDNKFIPIGMNMEIEENKLIAKNELKIEGSHQSYILDSRGRIVSFVSNTSMPVIIGQMAQMTINSPFFSLPYYDEALAEAQAKGKHVILFVVGSILQNNELLAKFNDPELLETIETYFVPTALFSYHKQDSLKLIPLSGENDDWIGQDNIASHSNIFQLSISTIGVAVISGEGKILYRKSLNKFDKESLTEIIESMESNSSGQIME